jgi:hypothetical protein
MTTATRKIWLTAGAFAVAAAAALSPVTAQAAPADDTGSDSSAAGGAADSSGVGDSAGASTPRRAPRPVGGRGQTGTPAVGAPRAAVGDNPAAGATGSNPLFQNPLIWFGTPNPNPPTPAYTRTFNPLASLPGWTNSYSGWYRNMDFEACVLGLSNTTTRSLGPYGTATSSVSTGGC